MLENVLDCSEASKTCSCEGANTNACAHPEVGHLVMLVCPVACAPTNGSTYIATTVVTTNIVSTPSVLPVSTTSAPAVVTLADTGCPRNCGTPEQGGGTCATRPSDGMLICRSCNNNRIRQKGLCLLEVHCRARKVQSGILKGQGCQCANPRCHNCKRKATSQGGDTCLVCRDGWYLLNGECIEMCPVGLTMSGISSFRRRCLEPYVCKGGRLFDGSFSEGTLVERGETFGCRCPAPGNKVGGNCFACVHGAGGFGDVCLRCSGGKFLHDGACIDECPVGTSAAGVGNYGRTCELIG